MFELIALPKNANPDKDWTTVATYAKRGWARRKMWALVHECAYSAIILRDVRIQDRDDLIRRMNDRLQKEV